MAKTQPGPLQPGLPHSCVPAAAITAGITPTYDTSGTSIPTQEGSGAEARGFLLEENRAEVI